MSLFQYPNRLRAWTVLLFLALLPLFLASRSEAQEPAEPIAAQSPTEEPLDITQLGDAWLRINQVSKWTGDLDGMIDRGFIRVLTPYSKTHYFLDGGRERGLTAEVAQALEAQQNKKLRPDRKSVHVIVIPVRRDQLFPYLVRGLGDMAVGNLTITPERQTLVDFTNPIVSDVKELVVTGPGVASIESVDDLSGREVWVRPSSSYYESLLRLNSRFRESGKDEILVRKADENLQDEDILEMVNAGLLPATVVDSHKLEWLWQKVFTKITVHPNVAVREKGKIGVAVRKESPLLLAELNAFYKAHRIGTAFGNIIIKRYHKNTRWVLNAAATNERKKYLAVVDLFKKYAQQYDFDYLMLMAQGYQESTLKQNTRSHAGAVGIMQVLPSTASGSPIFIPDIEKTEPNIHAGVKYMRYLVDEYFNDPDIDPVNRLLLAFASYNAGPNRIARLRREAADHGFDPNQWFRNVEYIVASKISQEPVRYVANIYKYYLAYARLRDLEMEK
jgi:membrane-bound lytic murein transglycosylase MltF